MSIHDSGYKRLFSHPEMIRDLLVGFVREPWIADLDFASLETYRGEFIADRRQQRRNDVIWRLRPGPDWFYVYVLLAFQSGVHPFMAARLSTDLDLLYQDLIRGRQLGRRRRLPPVLPIVLYNGRRYWTAPTDLADLIDPAPAWLDAYRPSLRYLLIDAGALEEIRIMLTDRVLDWTQQWKQEGLQAGRQEGLHSERRMLRRQIRRRFGEGVAIQSIPLLERIAQPEVFEDLGEALFDCADDRAWLARLNTAVEIGC